MSSKILEGIREQKAEYLKRLEELEWRADYRERLRARVEKLQSWELDVLEWFQD